MILSNRYKVPLALILCISLFSSCTSDNETGDGSCDISGYKTKQIGEQVWMAENINCDVVGSKCYDNDSANCTKYGRLYNWKVAMSVCPSGWHLPSDADWNKLINYVENNIDCYGCAGKYLKATSGWSEDGNGQDTYGFSALPGGIGSIDSSFRDIGDYGVWWSSSECYDYNAYGRLMYYAYDYSYYDVGDKEILLSVRCVKDIWNP
ncbi:MAG: fibrobacter succinogenes major paralogous domain-containing protein [Fibromonadales bacterium]|nr:fibrobacter succinogenes major paralogous domain-containing protein [Fibromonadales bacterium]